MKIEELEKEINDIEETLNNLKIKVEELKKNKNSFEPTPKGWEPKHKEKYWIAHYNLKPTVFFNDEEYLNEPIIKYNRTFKTKEECQLYCDIQRAFKDASREFKYNSNNYYIWYDHLNKEIKYDCLFSVQHKDIYFDSKKTIENLINKFGEENVKRYYLEVY
jgi:hypothetical protein